MASSMDGTRLRPLNALAALEDSFFAHREDLLRFLRARGAGDAAEDLLQDLWLRLGAAAPIAVAAPLPYMLRAANRLMIDRYRSERQAALRDSEWQEAQWDAAGASPAPSAERDLAARQHLAAVEQVIAALGARPAAIFRRHRIDGIAQKRIAQEMGVSLSTVEADLRRAYRALDTMRETRDEV